MGKKILRHTDLEVYKKAFALAMDVFELSKQFPREEMYSLTDQVRRSSRSVCTNLAESWRKHRYENHFISKLSNGEMEAAETQSWLQFIVSCRYLTREQVKPLYQSYEVIIKMLVTMAKHPESWTLERK
jgi:four helix bundle protein